jgi:hypothetical protein
MAPPDGYKSWTAMLQRCRNAGCPDYPRYGGRGIQVCEQWASSFKTFISDMGPRPSQSHSIDRIDNDGNYEPGNCRWATKAEQVRNRRITKLEPHEPAQIRWLYSLGYKQAEIGQFFDIGQPEVSRLLSGDRNYWKEEG